MGEQDYQKIFSFNLRNIMNEQKKSQIDIVNDLGYNKSAVSTWVNGSRLPRMDKVDALARYFGVSRSDLLENHIVDEETLTEKERRVRVLMKYFSVLSEESLKKLEERAEELVELSKLKKDKVE